MSAAVSLDRVPGMPSSWIVLGGEPIGLLIPPQTDNDAWEIWNRGEWTPHRFPTEGEALEALGLIVVQLEGSA